MTFQTYLFAIQIIAIFGLACAGCHKSDLLEARKEISIAIETSPVNDDSITTYMPYYLDEHGMLATIDGEVTSIESICNIGGLFDSPNELGLIAIDVWDTTPETVKRAYDLATEISQTLSRDSRIRLSNNSIYLILSKREEATETEEENGIGQIKDD